MDSVDVPVNGNDDRDITDSRLYHFYRPPLCVHDAMLFPCPPVSLIIIFIVS